MFLELFEIFQANAKEKIRNQKNPEPVATLHASESSLVVSKENTVGLITLDVSRTFPGLCIFQKVGDLVIYWSIFILIISLLFIGTFEAKTKKSLFYICTGWTISRPVEESASDLHVLSPWRWLCMYLCYLLWLRSTIVLIFFNIIIRVFSLHCIKIQYYVNLLFHRRCFMEKLIENPVKH